MEQTRWLIQRLLNLLSGMAAAGSSDKTAEFRAEIDTCARTIISPLPGESIDAAVRKCLALCQDFFQTKDSHRLNHDGAYGEIIDALRDALRTLANEAALDGMIVSSGARFREMVQVQDIFQLKKRIVEEVVSLERAVREHQANRQRTLKSLTERAELLEQRLNRTRERLSVSLAESSLDPLTRVANRRHFDLQLAAWMEPYSRAHPFVLAMFDIDNFKRVNDAYGHQIGDRVLRAIARAIRQVTRDEDVLARYGGEEFVLLLRNVTAETARERCGEILTAVSSQEFEWRDPSRTIRLRSTISCGIAEFERGDTAYELLQRADRALYKAKKSGKNRIEIQYNVPVEAGAPDGGV